MIAYSEALQHLLDAATPLPAEHLPLHEAGVRTLASDIISEQSLPPFDNSAMDGFERCAPTALRSKPVPNSRCRAGRPPAMPVPKAARVPGKS